MNPTRDSFGCRLTEPPRGACRRFDDRGSALMVALLVMVVLSLLGAAFLGLSNSETLVVSNAVASEGAFFGAEAAVNTGLSQLGPNVTISTLPIPVTEIAPSYEYRSGTRNDTAPQPIQFLRSETGPGYSIEVGTGYNASGYVFNVYQVNGTGTGPRNAQREIEVQALYGPASQ